MASTSATPEQDDKATIEPQVAPQAPRDPNDPMTWAERQLFPHGAAPPLGGPPTSENNFIPTITTTRESIDERCWIRSKQTNARRALGREPQVTMYCYMNLKKQIADLVPAPGQRGAYLVKEKPSTFSVTGPKPYEPPASSSPPPTVTVPSYHWPRLDDRYIYIARGRSFVNQHLQESGGPSETRTSIEALKERCQENQMNRANDRKTLAVKRALGLIDPIQFDEYERLISLSETWSHSLQRLHLHVYRIYSPGLRNLYRLPEVWQDGTVERMVAQCREKLTDGSAFKLVGRMYESTVRVLSVLEERRESRKNGGAGGAGGEVAGGSGIGGGSGGMVPPLPPPVGGPPPM